MFRQKVTETDHEIRVISSDGLSERNLAAISLKDIRQRFPDASSIRLEYGWLEGTQRVFVLAGPLYELGTPPLDTVVVVDALTGEAKTIAPPGAVYALWSSPDGNQLAALGLGEVRLIDARNGQLQSVIPLSWSYVENPLNYSPDGKLLTILTPSGVAIIDTTNGRQREILVDYMLWGAGDSFLYVAPLRWRDNESFIMIAAPPLEVPVEGLDLFTELLDWEFVVYEVDAIQGPIRALQTLRGSYPSIVLSPNLDRLGYIRFMPGSNGQEQYLAELYLADLTTGEQTLYATGDQISSLNWAPDSRRFFYAAMMDDQWETYLGELDREPRPYAVRAHSIRWIDEDRFLAKPASPDLELHLYSVRGEDILIASVQSGE